MPDDLRSRRYLANSSCGICGKAALDEVEVRCAPVGAGPRVAASVVQALPDRLAAHQRVFDQTGGLHAAARFTAAGELVAAREDVGRHNALDKLIGHALLDGALPLDATGAARVGPAVVRARAEGGDRGHPGAVRGVGAVEPRGRGGRAVRPDGRGLPARRAFQRVHAPRPHRSRGLMARRRGDKRDLVHGGGRPRREFWVGWKPNGLGEQKPHHYRGIAKTVWENRRNLPWAWRILRKGVCDGCALGVAGFHDWTISGVHLCSTRLDLLQVNTAAAIDARRAAPTSARWSSCNGRELRALGRLAHPMVRHARRQGIHAGSRGTTRST